VEIESEAFIDCTVAADGNAVSLRFVDPAGTPTSLKLTIDQVGALAMTLPALIEKALHKRHGDPSLRYAYPLVSWSVEQSSDPATRMITLGTVDGFSVCFSVPVKQQGELGKALTAEIRYDLAPLMN
jgi:hypothetical protein